MVSWLAVFLFLFVVRGEAAPTWRVLAPLEDYHCVPMIPNNSVNSLTHNKLLRVYTLYSSQIIPMALNLMESMLSAFPVVDTRTRVVSSSDCFSSEVSDGVYSEKATPLQFDGVCVGAFYSSLHHQDVNGGALPVETAALGSERYYKFLREKLALLTSLIVDATGNSMGGVTLVPWVLFLDSDVQLFPGFYQMISHKIRCPQYSAQCRHTNYQGGCQGQFLNSTIDAYFQRESKKLINTGVALLKVDSASRGARCLYELALGRYSPTKFGDQTVIQQILKEGHGTCRRHLPPSTTSTNNSGDGEEVLPLVHQVFHRLEVNANALNITLMVAQHAHMFGVHKMIVLREVLDKKRSSSAEGFRGGELHSGVFLTIDGGRKVTVETLCGGEPLPPSGASNVVSTACAVLCIPLSVGNGSRLPLYCKNFASPMPSSAASMPPPPTAAVADAPVTQSLQENSIFPSNVSVAVADVHVAEPAIKQPLKTGHKVALSVLPALLVLMTLTLYHYYVADDGPEGGSPPSSS